MPKDRIWHWQIHNNNKKTLTIKMNRWDIRLVICDGTYEKNQVYIDATIQFRPVSPATRVETHGFWHSLAPCCGEKTPNKTEKPHKKNKTHLYKLSPVCTKSDIICLSPVKMLMFRSFHYFPHEPVRSSPLPEVQFLWTQWRAGPGDPKR